MLFVYGQKCCNFPWIDGGSYQCDSWTQPSCYRRARTRLTDNAALQFPQLEWWRASCGERDQPHRPRGQPRPTSRAARPRCRSKSNGNHEYIIVFVRLGRLINIQCVMGKGPESHTEVNKRLTHFQLPINQQITT